MADLYDLDAAAETVGADMWLWSVCPRAELDPTRRLEFVNATETTLSGHSIVKVAGEYWSQVKVVGKFRQHFHLESYPFDRQLIEILIEDNQFNTSQLVFQPDTANSTYDHSISLDYFKVVKFGVGVGIHKYPTNFGDPSIPSGKGSDFSQFTIALELSRVNLSSFVEETWPVYVAIVFTLISYLIWSEDSMTGLTTRYGILGAAVFALVVNMRAASQSLGAVFGVTLVDGIHLLALMYTLVALVTTTYVWRHLGTPEEKGAARRVNTVVAITSTGLYLAVNAVMVLLALH
ncbi:hypothetical protein [Streptomyces sp. NPDC127084]|uniref:hypothetical protein n=1 Tax=Streptomyces sp. NPDC127084 TaxID=3347133 RepID=UPI0036501A23